METMTFFAPCGNLMIDRSTRCFKVYKTFSFPLSSQNKQTEQKPLDRRLGKIGLKRPAGNNAIVGKKGLKKPKGYLEPRVPQPN